MKKFYLDEMWVGANVTFEKCWHSPEINGVLTYTNFSNRLIIIKVGTEGS